jgi:hypothetical protein
MRYPARQAAGLAEDEAAFLGASDAPSPTLRDEP